MACDGSNINPVALAVLNAKLPNGQFAVPSPQIVIPNSGPDPYGPVPAGTVDVCDSGALPRGPVHGQHRPDAESARTCWRDGSSIRARRRRCRSRRTAPRMFRAGARMSWTATRCLCWRTRTSSARTWSTLRGLATCGLMVPRRYRTRSPPSRSDIGTPTGAAGPTSNAPAIIGRRIHDRRCGQRLRNGGVTNSFIWQDTVALTKGRHNARFGVEFKRHQVDVDTPTETDGLLQIPTFDDFLLGQSAAQNGSPTGAEQCRNEPVREEASSAGTSGTRTLRSSRRTTSN